MSEANAGLPDGIPPTEPVDTPPVDPHDPRDRALAILLRSWIASRPAWSARTKAGKAAAAALQWLELKGL